MMFINRLKIRVWQKGEAGMEINLVIADDHKIVREGIKVMLQDEPWIEVAGEACDGEEVLEILERNHIDLVLLDIDMPCMDGICCAKNIHKYWPDTRVLIVSMHQSEKFVIEAFRAGVAGYISKDTSKGELLNAISTIAEGNSYFGREVSQKLYNYLNRPEDRPPASSWQDEPALTAREVEVLALIAKEYTNQEIADQLFISPHTVVTHRRNLLQKFNARNTAGLLNQASRYGMLHHD